MAIADYIKKIPANKIIVPAGIAGMLLIMISSLIPDRQETAEPESSSYSEAIYLSETEKRLGDFLESIEGVGNVKLMITLKGGELYTYIHEDRKSISGDRTETDKSYVMSGREKAPVLESISNPEIMGAVIACEGASDPSVKSDIYNTVSRILGIPTSDIYVTELK